MASQAGKQGISHDFNEGVHSSDADRLRQIMSHHQQDGLTCAAALELARKLGLSPEQVGHEAEEQGIKIRKCSLGCF